MASNIFTPAQQAEVDAINRYWAEVDAAIALAQATAETRRVDESFRLAEAKAEDEAADAEAEAEAEAAKVAALEAEFQAELKKEAEFYAWLRAADPAAYAGEAEAIAFYTDVSPETIAARQAAHVAQLARVEAEELVQPGGQWTGRKRSNKLGLDPPTPVCQDCGERSWWCKACNDDDDGRYPRGRNHRDRY
jgi:hypothetical protein